MPLKSPYLLDFFPKIGNNPCDKTGPLRGSPVDSFVYGSVVSSGSSVGSGASVSMGSGKGVGVSAGSGEGVGSGVGADVGVGVAVGAYVGVNVGIDVGSAVSSGISVGSAVGSAVSTGTSVGSAVGVGAPLGLSVGSPFGVASSVVSSVGVASSVGSSVVSASVGTAGIMRSLAISHLTAIKASTAITISAVIMMTSFHTERIFVLRIMSRSKVFRLGSPPPRSLRPLIKDPPYISHCL